MILVIRSLGNIFRIHRGRAPRLVTEGRALAAGHERAGVAHAAVRRPPLAGTPRRRRSAPLAKASARKILASSPSPRSGPLASITAHIHPLRTNNYYIDISAAETCHQGAHTNCTAHPPQQRSGRPAAYGLLQARCRCFTTKGVQNPHPTLALATRSAG